MIREKTILLQKQMPKEMMAEATRLKASFEGYLEDLELFSNPAFWESIEEIEGGKLKRFSNAKEMIRELDN